MPSVSNILTVQNLIDATQSLLDESSNSQDAEYDDGNGNTLSSSPETIMGYLQDAAAWMCETCLYYPVLATRQLTNKDQNSLLIPLSSIQDANGSYCWAVTYVSYDAVQLPQTTEAGLSVIGTSILTTPNGVPQRWYKSGNLSVSLLPRPVDLGTIAVYGPGIAPVPANPEEQITWCMPHHVIVLARYAAEQVSWRNYPENSLLAQKAQVWKEQRQERAWLISQSLKLQNPQEYAAYFVGKIAASSGPSMTENAQQGQ